MKAYTLVPEISSAWPDDVMLRPGTLKLTPVNVSTVMLKPPAMLTMAVEPTLTCSSAHVVLTPSSKPLKAKVSTASVAFDPICRLCAE